tara:strand:+ start:49 stop:273 length:225 start_codon:yes stop_codon:yes gene_type:complete
MNAEQEWLEKMYFDYFNNFLTVDTFAEHYGLSMEQANEIINKGRAINLTRPVVFNYQVKNKKYKEWIASKEVTQ